MRKKNLAMCVLCVALLAGCGNTAQGTNTDSKNVLANSESNNVENESNNAESGRTFADAVTIEEVTFLDMDGNVIEQNEDRFYEVSNEFQIKVKCDKYFSNVRVFYTPTGSSMTEETVMLAIGSNRDENEYTITVPFNEEESMGHIQIEAVTSVGIYSDTYNVIRESVDVTAGTDLTDNNKNS